MKGIVCHSATILAFVLFALGLSRPSFAAPTVRQDYPCKGCLFLPPAEGSTKSPLLVVLHGDAPGGKTPLVKRDSEPFVLAAAERGIAVFAPMCPKEEGCLVGSYWQWSQGDPPAWIEAQIDVLSKDVSIDPDRIWIAGWSGGASFLGWHYARLSKRYAAVVFAGGGIPPASSTCSACSPPSYFLVGNKNPLHHLAKALHTSVLSCTNDVTWDLLPGKEHSGEWRALNQKPKLGEIFDWLAKHPRHCAQVVDKPAASVAPVVTAATPSVVPESKPAPIAAAPKPPPIPAKRSGCAFGGFSESNEPTPFLTLLLAGLVTRRRNRFIRANGAMNRTGRDPKKASKPSLRLRSRQTTPNRDSA